MGIMVIFCLDLELLTSLSIELPLFYSPTRPCHRRIRPTGMIFKLSTFHMFSSIERLYHCQCLRIDIEGQQVVVAVVVLVEEEH